MQLQNFECQIAKAQIGRFLAGDGLSEETVEQLEAHIAKCRDCKENLAERKIVLQATLSSSEQAQPTQKAKFDLADFVKSKIQSKQPVHAAVQAPATKQGNLTKPAVYSLALGVVLIGMSYASKNVGSIFGPTVAAGTVVNPPATKSAVPTTTTPKTAVRKPFVRLSIPPRIEPKKTIAPTSKSKAPVIHPASTTTKATPRPKSHKASRHSSNSNSIRVYAPENQP